MRGEGLRPARLLALFLLGCLAFNAPVLRLFSRDATVAGLPLVAVYLFGAWAVLIALVAWAVRAPRGPS